MDGCERVGKIRNKMVSEGLQDSKRGKVDVNQRQERGKKMDE